MSEGAKEGEGTAREGPWKSKKKARQSLKRETMTLGKQIDTRKPVETKVGGGSWKKKALSLSLSLSLSIYLSIYLSIFYRARSCIKWLGSWGSATLDPCSKRCDTKVKFANTRVSSGWSVGSHT
jgi:hypothetical protein